MYQNIYRVRFVFNLIVSHVTMRIDTKRSFTENAQVLRRIGACSSLDLP